MLKCGLLGKKLGHSYSPAIHARLGDYFYGLFEKEEAELEDFLKNGDWDGLNVTIPYKKTVLPYCAQISDIARETGSVNTLVKRPDGTIFGDNTDAPGFAALVRKTGIAVENEKVLILGSGGAGAAVSAALKRMKAGIVVIGRNAENNYGNISKHADAAVIVNTTPVGMYPDNLDSPLDLSVFPFLKGVIDVVYNPALTGILLQAEERGIPHANGLYMLAAQARRSSELFTGTKIPGSVVEEITNELASSMKNIILIGMPGSGKSAVAEALGKATGRPVFDSDEEIVKKAGMSITAIFEKYGEEHFRELETEVLEELGKASGTIVSTGGGCVTKERNYPLLHQNGKIVWIKREISILTREGRPLSAGNLQEMYEKRRPMYERFADVVVGNDKTVAECVDRITQDDP